MADLIKRTDTLNQGREKLNTAITDANRAKWDARTAKTKAEQALLKSESTQTQLNEIVIEGDSSVEAAQARVDEEGKNHATLKERVDDGFMKITTQLADIAINVKKFGAIGADTDDTIPIQEALNFVGDSGGGTVFIPDGLYRTSDTLEIFEGTTLELAPNAIIRKIGNFSPMLLNGRKGIDNFELYEGNGNIVVRGGTFDGNYNPNSKRSSEIMFAHCENILIENVTFIGNFDSHCIELNSTKNGKVVNCTFKDQVADRRTEMIQIDGAYNDGVFPHLGYYDNTPCIDILIQGCTFMRGDRAIGTHHGVEGIEYTHKYIRIIGNHFEDMEAQAIRGWDWQDVVVSGNTFLRCGEGIECRSVHNKVYKWTIVGNILDGIERIGSAIWFSISDSELGRTGERGCYNTTVTGNTIKNTGSRGISALFLHTSSITGNTISNTVSSGIALHEGCNRNVVSNNQLTELGAYGIWLTGESSHNSIVGNVIHKATDTGLRLASASNHNLVHSNVIHETVEALFVTGTCLNCFVTNNWVTSGSASVGSPSHTTAGNLFQSE